MPSVFTSTKFFNRPIDHQSTSNDRLKPVMTTGLVNMHIDRSIANLAFFVFSRDTPFSRSQETSNQLMNWPTQDTMRAIPIFSLEQHSGGWTLYL